MRLAMAQLMHLAQALLLLVAMQAAVAEVLLLLLLMVVASVVLGLAQCQRSQCTGARLGQAVAMVLLVAAGDAAGAASGIGGSDGGRSQVYLAWARTVLLLMVSHMHPIHKLAESSESCQP